MKLTFIINALSAFALVNAKTFNFNVVSIYGPSYTLAVKYGTTVTPLKYTTFPLFNGTIEANNISQYKYVVIDQSGSVFEEESINRVYSEENAKINEVYNRTNKKVSIPDLPEPFSPMFSMGSKDFKPFPNDEIFNFYANCDQKAYTELTDNPFNEETGDINTTNINCTFNIITKKKAFTSPGTLHIIGYGSRQYKKLSWAIKLENKFKGRKAVKLRALANDPTLIREKLISEFFNSVGVPVQEGTYARVIINNDVYGLYSFADSLSSKWISSYIHGNDDASIGVSYKMFSQPPNLSDLKYKGEDYKLYSETNTYEIDEFEEEKYQQGNEADKWKPLIDFTKLYDEWVKNYGNDTSDKALDELRKFLNIEEVLRLLAVESLVLALDNFWLRTSNAALYYNPERKNYLLIPYDFDQAMYGSKDVPTLDPVNYMKDCITWVNYDEKEMDHFFSNHLLKHPKIKERYDVILAKTSRETFNPETVALYVQAVAYLIREDVEWNNKAIDNVNISYEGKVNHFTLNDFESNLEYGHVDFDESINTNDAPFGIKEWIEERGQNCKAYTANVDISNNENISDKVDVKVYRSGSSMVHCSNFSFLFILVLQFILYIII